MDFAVARHNMVENQIRTNKVTDPAVVDAMAEIPREVFVRRNLQGVAYVDEALPMGDGRYVMEPMVIGRLLQAAEITSDDVVLTIGCGAGYAPAVLSKLASAVVAVESDSELASRATEKLSDLGIDTVAVIEGDLDQGYPKQAPYDVVFFNGAVADVPAAITDQLAEGGRLVAVVVEGGVGTAVLVTRFGAGVARRKLFEAGTPVLPGLGREVEFAF